MHHFHSRSRVAVASKKFEGKTELTEPWYGSSYNYRKIDPRLIEEWKTVALNEELHLPAVNEFIPTDFEILSLGEHPPKEPTLIQVQLSMYVYQPRVPGQQLILHQ